MSKYLYGASVQGIQDYIFTTNELKSIVGASEIIKNINEEIKKKYNENIIINAAGNIKLIFNDQSEFRDLVENFLKTVKQNAFGLTISQAVVEFEEGKLKEAFQELEAKLYLQRNKAEIPLDMNINILQTAPKTAKPSVQKDKDKATLQKEVANPSKANMPKNKKNKTAVIHADGNNLGAMIAAMSENLTSDVDVIRAYKDFSTQLENATNSAFEIAKESFDEKDIRKIILGGDDLTIVCNANIALNFTNKFLKAFEEETKKEFQNDGLTACAGIAYANHKYPFHYAVNLAESLCGYAKKHSRQIMKDGSLSLAPSSLMFHNIQSANFNDFSEYIDNELTLNNTNERVSLNYGPYFIEPQKEYSRITSFEQLANILTLKGSPMSRLREWLTILGQDSLQAKERLKRIDSVMDMTNKLYNKKALSNFLEKFHKDLKLNNLTITRNGEIFTPIHDLDTYLSVIDSINTEEQKDEL
jgi:CRISPR/Cas system-associated protein Cas10 (large subunit of type III CRISPR-Cas system)